jgi:hypothetical protein
MERRLRDPRGLDVRGACSDRADDCQNAGPGK